MADVLHLVPPHRVQGLPRHSRVDGVAVGPGDNGGVVGRLGPALQLEGVESRLHQLPHMVDHAHVPGVQDVSFPIFLKNGEILPGALLLHEGILVPAGLGAGPPVGVPARHVVGQEAPPGIAYAHGPVGKGLQLQLLGGLGPDLPDLVQGQLPGQDDPLGPQVVPGPGTLVVDHAGLGGDVPLHMGGVLPGQGEHPHVGQNHRVHPQAVQVLQPLRQAGCLLVPGHGVAGDVDPDALAVTQLHGGLQLLRAKIARKGAHAEGGAGQIDRVGPVSQGHLQPLHIPRRGQKLNFLLVQGNTSQKRAPEHSGAHFQTVKNCCTAPVRP